MESESLVFLFFLKLFDRNELMQCLKKFISIEKDWVPKSSKASLYIRPTFIGTDVNLVEFKIMFGTSVPNYFFPIIAYIGCRCAE
jgi:hypothetical protein